MRNYRHPISLLGLAAAMTACGKKAEQITPAAMLDRYATQLVQQHKPDLHSHSAPLQTRAMPLSYGTQFFTNTQTMLTGPVKDGDKSAYEKNLAITERWQQMYCTDALQARLRETGIAIASAQLIDSASGQKHSLAVCVATQPKSPPPPSTAPQSDTAPFSLSQICKAGLSVVYGRNTDIMSATVQGNQVQVQYTRPSDGKAMSYRCKLEQGLILTWDDSIAGARWYGAEAGDSRLEFRIAGNQLLIRETPNGNIGSVLLKDNAVSEKLFSPTDIGSKD